MEHDEISIYKRALEREKAARHQAEKILEEKSRDLYNTSLELKDSNLKLEKLLFEKSTQLKGVFENIIDAYVVMDLKGNVIKLNNAAIELFGYNANDKVLNVNSLIYKDDYNYAIESFLTLTEQGFFTNYKARVYTKFKGVRWVHINASIVYNKDKQPIAAQGIVRDITDRKNLESQKEKLLQELEKSNEELHEYAHIVSHDLKSPLRSINTLVSWIREDNEGRLDDTTLENFGHIENTLEKMELLISDLLNYASIDSNSNHNTSVDLDRLIKDLIPILYTPDHISINVKSTLPTVTGDKVKLQQLFQNLLSNAIKFIDKDKGLITINVEEQKTHYKFSIEDNGIGIEKKYYEKIFKIFQSLQKRKDSTGIGLSIVKKIVDIHNGKIWVESEPNIRTTFYFTLKK